MKEVKADRYFIAWIPSYRVKSKIQNLKALLQIKFGINKSMNAPPHLTLIKPFELGQNELEHLQHVLCTFCKLQDPFEFKMQGLGSFGQHVLYVHLDQTDALLKFREALRLVLKETTHLSEDTLHPDFHPHITLATKDLKPSLFSPVWAFLLQKIISEKCTLANICLLHYQNNQWQVIRKFNLKKQLGST